MVVPAAQSPESGLWFSADVVFAELSVTGATFATDLATPTVGSSLDVVLEAVSQRGTVIGLDVESETIVHLLLDYAQAYSTSGTTVGNQVAQDILDDIEGDIDADGALSASAFSNVGVGFRAGSGPD